MHLPLAPPFNSTDFTLNSFVFPVLRRLLGDQLRLVWKLLADLAHGRLTLA